MKVCAYLKCDITEHCAIPFVLLWLLPLPSRECLTVVMVLLSNLLVLVKEVYRQIHCPRQGSSAKVCH